MLTFFRGRLVKNTNIKEYENSLPKKVILERKCEGLSPTDCIWQVTFVYWKKKTKQGIIKDDSVLDDVLDNLLKNFTPYYDGRNSDTSTNIK